jgi:hypothetical protein
MSDTPPRLQIQRRETWIELPPEYPGFKMRVWVNPPTRLWNDVASGDDARTRAALKAVALEHNGWCDIEGKLFEQPSTDSFWDDIPTELAALVIVLIQKAMTALPNSLTPKPRR